MTATGRAAVSGAAGSVAILIVGILSRLGVDLAPEETAAITTLAIAAGHELTRQARKRRATK